jgi:hypothetical protein
MEVEVAAPVVFAQEVPVVAAQPATQQKAASAAAAAVAGVAALTALTVASAVEVEAEGMPTCPPRFSTVAMAGTGDLEEVVAAAVDPSASLSQVWAATEASEAAREGEPP